MFCQSWFNKEHNDSYQQHVIINACYCSRETPLYFQLSVSVFFHLLNNLEIRRRETTSSGELNEQLKSLLQHLFSLECLVCIDRAGIPQSDLLLSSEDSSSTAGVDYLSPPFPELLLLTPIPELFF